MYNIKVFKVLTRNDTGETHSHQSGITIPKKVADTGIFPHLGTERLNPRENVMFFDENKKMWKFQYIYYNDVFWRKEKSKSHNEHRLTCVRQYILENNIRSGDSIWFSIDDNGIRHIGFDKQKKEKSDESKIIVIGSGWHYIKI